MLLSKETYSAFWLYVYYQYVLCTDVLCSIQFIPYIFL